MKDFMQNDEKKKGEKAHMFLYRVPA